MIAGDKTYFHIVYDGPALENNEMTVKDLAPALIALSDVIDSSNSVVNGGRAEVEISVKASFKTGCFGIELAVVQSIVQNIIDVVSSEHVKDGVAVLSLLGFTVKDGVETGARSLLQLIKWVSGRKIKKIIANDKETSVIIIDEEEYEVENTVLELFKNVGIRRNLEKVIYEPLRKDGIDSFACTDLKGTKPQFFIVGKDESESFKAPQVDDDLIGEQIIETSLHMLSVAFQQNNKWRFSDGLNSFYAEIQDTDFLKKVQKNEIGFRKDDILKVSLKREQWLTDAGIKTEYTILKILERRSAARQLDLPFENSEK